MKHWIAIAGVWAMFSAISGGVWAADLAQYQMGKDVSLGGEFTLTSTEEKALSLSDLKGKAVFFAFGYTHCPDICPITLATMQGLLNQLGKRTSEVQMLLLSVDPQRDTPAHLKQYIAQFDPRILGLTGSEVAVRKVATQYGGSFYRTKTHPPAHTGHKAAMATPSHTGNPAPMASYEVAHSTHYYLMGPKGKLKYLFPHTTPRAVLLEAIKTLL